MHITIRASKVYPNVHYMKSSFLLLISVVVFSIIPRAGKAEAYRATVTINIIGYDGSAPTLRLQDSEGEVSVKQTGERRFEYEGEIEQVTAAYLTLPELGDALFVYLEPGSTTISVNGVIDMAALRATMAKQGHTKGLLYTRIRGTEIDDFVEQLEDYSYISSSLTAKKRFKLLTKLVKKYPNHPATGMYLVKARPDLEGIAEKKIVALYRKADLANYFEEDATYILGVLAKLD